MGVEAGLEKSSTPMLVLCVSCNTPKDSSDFKKNRRSCNKCCNKKDADRADRKRRSLGIPRHSEVDWKEVHKNGHPYSGTYAIDENGFRNCTSCGDRKHSSEFYASSTRRGGIVTVCKPCSLKASREYNFKNRLHLTMKRHGMTVDDYDSILISQSGSCAICKTKDPGGENGRFCVDHDHKTGIVRGLLCNPCNWGIGHLRDNPEILRSAIQYLEKNRTAQTAEDASRQTRAEKL